MTARRLSLFVCYFVISVGSFMLGTVAANAKRDQSAAQPPASPVVCPDKCPEMARRLTARYGDDPVPRDEYRKLETRYDEAMACCAERVDGGPDDIERLNCAEALGGCQKALHDCTWPLSDWAIQFTAAKACCERRNHEECDGGPWRENCHEHHDEGR